MRIKVLLLGTPEVCIRTQKYLKDDEIAVVGSVQDELQILDEINRTAANLVLITEVSPMTLRACHQIYLLRPRAVPIVISETEEINMLQRIMQNGVHYILDPGIDSLTLSSELKSIYNNESNRIHALENTNAAPNKSQVLTIFGPRDGAGKTTLAVNLAIKLAQNKNKVVVLDYNLQFGDVGTLFGVNYKNTILELLQEQSNPNADMIRQFLSMHVSGVSFLPAPHGPEYASAITTGQTERIIAALRVHYDYVIIDTSSMFDDTSAACIECASSVLFVTEKDIPALKNAKKALTVLRELCDKEKIKLIIGRENNKLVTAADINRVLGVSVWGTLPSDEKTVTAAVNQGSPLVLESSKSKVSKVIAEMAQRLDSSQVKDRTNDGKAKTVTLFKRKGRR